MLYLHIFKFVIKKKRLGKKYMSSTHESHVDARCCVSVHYQNQLKISRKIYWVVLHNPSRVSSVELAQSEAKQR